MGQDYSTWFNTFDRHPRRNAFLLLSLYVFINNSINATSVWMEQTRDGAIPSIQLWEPFAWEYTSALATLICIPLAVWFFKRPFHSQQVTQWLLIQLAGSVCFSICHISLMVWFRKQIYWAAGRQYDFGNIPAEFFYEYRKDLWGYLFLMLLYFVGKFVYSRLKGEAALVSEQNQENQTNAAPQHFIVKKLDKEFLVKVDDIEWLEASGNYVNLHVRGRIYPLRITLKDLCDSLHDKGFRRTHRSFAVNPNYVESIENLPSGDGQITMRGGNTLSLSRRYKDAFKQSLLPQ